MLFPVLRKLFSQNSPASARNCRKRQIAARPRPWPGPALLLERLEDRLFLLAATDDQVRLAPHSVALYQHWTAAGKSAELHLYSRGGHGFGMRKQGLPSDHWIERFADWLEVQGLLKK